MKIGVVISATPFPYGFVKANVCPALSNFILSIRFECSKYSVPGQQHLGLAPPYKQVLGEADHPSL